MTVMPNGKPHDNPITDIVIHGMHPYPEDLEQLVIELHRMNPGIFNDLEWAPFDWEKGKYLGEARELLKSLISNHGNTNAYKRLVEDYRVATAEDDL